MGQACCGQMHLNSGYRREAAAMVPGFARAFGDYAAVWLAHQSAIASGAARTLPRPPGIR